MKQGRFLLGVLLGVCGMGMLLVNPVSVEGASTQEMYRVYNPNSGEHFYTASKTERANLTKTGWEDEGIGWVAPTTGEPVYRLYNQNVGDHHYTMSESEKKNLQKRGWKYEGIGWYSSTNKEVPLYRVYNSDAEVGSHHYTTNTTEYANLLKAGWEDEGIAWYGVAGGTPLAAGYQIVRPKTSDAKKIANEIFDLTNAERTRMGKAPLSRAFQLDEAATLRSSEYYTKYSHTRPDGRMYTTALNDVGELEYKNNLQYLGENCTGLTANTYTSDNAAEKQMANWIASPSHYTNMLEDAYTQMGVGVYVASDGTICAVQWFSAPW